MRRLPTVLVAMSLLAGGAAMSQEQEEPLDSALTERVDVRYVIIDALVLDSRGHIVPDLTADDFELYLDRKPYPIETVDVHCPVGAAEDARPVEHGERRSASVIPGPLQRIALVIDYRQLPQTRRAEVIEQLETMVRNNDARNQELMVAAVMKELRIEQPFTMNRDEVLATLARMKRDPSYWQEPPTLESFVEFYSSPYLNDLDFFRALVTLIRVLGSYEGGKVIVLFSDMRSPGAADLEYDRQHEAVAVAATQARTAIYPIHARGLTLERSSTALARLAVETGGRFTENTNDLSLAYARAQRDRACLYAIGFNDREVAAGRMREVSLSVRRGAYRVLHPTQYRYGAAEDVRDALERTAFSSPAVFDSDTVTGRVIPLRPATKKKWLAALEMRFSVTVPEAGPRVVEFGARIDDTRHRVVQRIGRTLTIRPSELVQDQPILVFEGVELKPGDYELKIVVVDPAEGRPRAVSVPVSVPALPKRGLLVTPPLLIRDSPGTLHVHWGVGLGDREDWQEEAEVLQEDPVVASPLTAVTHVCRLGKKPQRVEVERKLHSQHVDRTSDPSSMELSLDSKDKLACAPVVDDFARRLRAGSYRYSLFARGGSASTSGHATFSVVPPVPVVTMASAATQPPPVVAVEPAAETIEWLEQLPAEPGGPVSPVVPEDVPPLEVILDRLTGVADVYAGNALKFTAEEVTDVRNYMGTMQTPKKMQLFNVYSYYRDGDGLLHERRIRRSAMKRLGKVSSIEEFAHRTEALGNPMANRYGVKGEQEVPAFLERPYLWTLLFSRESRKLYDYSVEPSTTDGAVSIRFRPKQSGDDEQWYGTAVVDLDTYQILHAEGVQEADHDSELAMHAMLASEAELPLDVGDRTFVINRASTRFDVVEHGLRFPSRTEVLIYVHRVLGSGASRRARSGLASRIVQTYKNYRFFDVEVGETLFLETAASTAGER